MEIREFLKRVADGSEYALIGVREGEDSKEGVVIRTINPVTQEPVYIFLYIDSILSNTWEELESVLRIRRPLVIHTQVSRIVGYFSQINNWNKSKLAELEGRHRGLYTVPENIKGKKEVKDNKIACKNE